MSDNDLSITNRNESPKIGIKGSKCVEWLQTRGIALPQGCFEAARIPEEGWVIRLGVSDFFLADFDVKTASQLAPQTHLPLDVIYHVPRSDATILLSGRRALEVFARTCGVDFRRAFPRRVTYTRVAGVSCAILTEAIEPTPRFRIWYDPSYTAYLWDTLATIVKELDGLASAATQANLAADRSLAYH